MRALLAAVALPFLLPLLAGCASPSPAPMEAEASAVVDAPAPPQSASQEFSWSLQVAGRNIERFDVDEGRSQLTADVTWSCTVPVACDLHVWLCDPEELEALPANPATPDCAAHEVGDGAVAFAVDDPMEGDWAVVFASDLPDVEVSGTIDFYAA